MARPSAPLLLLALGVWLAGAGCTAAHVAQDAWTVTQSSNFRVVSNQGDARSAELVRELEKFRAVVMSVTDGAVGTTGAPLTVYAFNNAENFETFAPSQYIGGYFRQKLDGRYAVLDASAQFGKLTLFHEYVHAVLAGSGVLYPAWYEEGLAEFLQMVRIHPDAVELGRPTPRGGLLQLARQGPALRPTGNNLQRRMTELEEGDLFYARAWATVDFLTLGHLTSEGGVDRREALARFLTGWGGKEGDAAYQAAFGMTEAELAKEVVGFVRRQDFPLIRMPLQTNAQLQALESRPLPAADAALELAQLMRDNGKCEQAESLYALALQADAGHVEALVGRASCLSARGEQAAAEQLFAQLETRAAGHPRLAGQRTRHLYRQLAREQASSSEPSTRQALLDARQWLKEALALHPQDVELLGLYGSTFLYAPAAEGLHALELAVLKAPTDMEANEWLGELQLRAGELSQARLHLWRVIQASHGGPGSARAKELLRELEAREDGANGE